MEECACLITLMVLGFSEVERIERGVSPRVSKTRSRVYLASGRRPAARNAMKLEYRQSHYLST